MQSGFQYALQSDIHPEELISLPNLFQRVPPLQTEPGVKRPLPVDEYLPLITETMQENRACIVVAETGAGKSTRVPAALLDAGFQVVVTQPRRLAARSVARRIAHERGEELGTVVGYRTAVDGVYSAGTRLLIVTDGLALAQYRSNERFNEPRIIGIDEVHELNTNIEMLLALLKYRMRHDYNCKVLLMSATTEAERLSRYMFNAPIISVPGREHKITPMKAGREIADDAARMGRRGKNVLVFLPGKADIERSMKRVRELGVNAELLPLHADLLPSEQDLCFEEYARPKIIFATNVAQTSITIPDIDVVIDSGLERQATYENGIEQLKFNPISLADERQRMGRAGRTHEGIFISHCPAPAKRRLAFPVPEILRTSLDQVVLRFAVNGLEIERLSLYNNPGRPQIREAKDLLVTLGCLDPELRVTELGDQIAKLPVGARIGCMLIEAKKRGVLDDMITAAALMENDGIRSRTADFKYSDTRSDIFSEMRLFAMGCDAVAEPDLEIESATERLESLGISPRAFCKALDARHHLSVICEEQFGSLDSSGNQDQLLASIVAGQADRLFVVRGDPEQVFLFSGGSKPRSLSRESALEFDWKRPTLVVGKPFDLEAMTRDGIKEVPLVTMATRVSLELLQEVFPTYVSIKSPEEPGAPTKVFYRDHLLWSGELR